MKTSKKVSNKKAPSQNRKQVLEALILFGLILLIPLFFAMRTRANSPTNAPAQENTPTEAPIVPTVAETGAQQPPACTFPLAQTTTEESTPEEYTFSEPQVVQADLSNIYEIIEWLPDNQRVLITQTYQDKHYQSIELLNPQTGETQIYATRTTVLGEPSWVPGLNAVIYPYTNLVNVDLSDPRAFQPPYHLKRQLWISYGDPVNAQMLENAEMTLGYLSVFSIAVKPDGSEIMYLSNTDEYSSLQEVSKSSLGPTKFVPFNSSQLAYLHKESNPHVSYNMLWRPKSSQVFLYTNVSHSSQEHYAFILDVENGQACRVSLSDKKMPAVDLMPRWSPNGRYLAFIAIGGFTVLDTATGKLYEMDQGQLISTDIKGQLAINDIAWAPDNKHLVAAAQVSDYSVPPGEDYIKLRNLYVIDFLSNQATQIPSDIKLGTYYGDTSVLWSDDGSKLLVMCSAPGGLCLLPVHQDAQP